MTPPSVQKVCRECPLFITYTDRMLYPKGNYRPFCDAARPCAALELLQTISAQSPSDCRSEERCLLAERLKKEVG